MTDAAERAGTKQVRLDRRSFTTALAGAVALGSAGTAASATREDVEPGCEGAVAALKEWIAALSKRDFGFLEQHLSSDFMFTAVPLKTPAGVMKVGVRDKAQFIAQDEHIYNSNIQFLSLAARRLGDLVITTVFAKVFEEVRGNLGPGMPSAAEMNAVVQNKVLGYASGWREMDGRWQCTSHHILGEVHQP